MTKLTVMMPCYNSEIYLPETLDSLRAQDMEFQLVVINDRSTDKSVEVIQSCWPNALVVEGNRRGIGSALNLALPHAEGEYFAWIDADDLWMSGKLQRQFEVLKEHPDWDGCFVAVEQFFHSPVPGKEPPAAQGRHRGSLLIKRSSFERVGPFREDIKIAEFVDWCARADQAGLVLGELDEMYYRRRIHETNTMKDANLDKRDYLKVLKAHLDRKRAVEGKN